jgi:aldehyde:ferredoxin oxidoreductase
MECKERSLLDDVPSFGDGPGLLRLLEQMARREGPGAILAEGSRLAAMRIGGEAPDFACHVKGLELPGYDPRALQAMALGLAVSTRGADHNRSGAYEEDFRAGSDRMHADPAKARAVVDAEDKAALIDSLVVCKFLRGAFADLDEEAAAMLSAVTGWDVTAQELRVTSERIVNAKKLFNQREGWTRAEDTLPPRFLTEALPSGASRGAALSARDLNRMISRYYELRGWDEQGRVAMSRVRALSLEDLLTRTTEKKA